MVSLCRRFDAGWGQGGKDPCGKSMTIIRIMSWSSHIVETGETIPRIPFRLSNPSSVWGGGLMELDEDSLRKRHLLANMATALILNKRIETPAAE